MSDDPFAEPSDSERTIIRPRPSGAARPAAAPPAGAAQPAAGNGEVRPVPKTGTNPLVAAAAPVLAAAIRINADRGRAPDIERLRRALVGAIRQFEQEALATGLDTRLLRAARYALCSTVDDMVLSTPWGAASNWAQQSMTSIFHNEVTGGERFYVILDEMQKDIGNNQPVIELMYLCMSLGFVGRYRVMPRGVAALTELREGLYRTIRQRRGDFERDLSPQWRGVDAGARSLGRRVPLWAIGLGALTVASVMYIVFTFMLASVSERAFAELYSLPPLGKVAVVHAAPSLQAPPPPPAVVQAAAAPPPPALAMKLRQFLAPEIKQGLVQVFEDAQTITVRLINRNMFGSGAATLGGIYPALLGRIADALNDEKGQVLVNGYTDNEPIHTARFPSNFELSQARADAVASYLRPHLKDPARLKVQGKGQADPIANNATAEGRAENRRTEIVLIRSSDAL
jgi:type VI secretion system protein ImpK